MTTTVRLLVQAGPSGRLVYEDVPATVEGGLWRLTASPGLAMGAAAGDLLRVAADRSFEVVERGGNIAVHVSAPIAGRPQLVTLLNALQAMGGWCDGGGWTRDRRSSLTVFTIPHRVGFTRIEAALREYASAVPAGEWYYGNVYDPTDDSTPLDWWLNLPPESPK